MTDSSNNTGDEFGLSQEFEAADPEDEPVEKARARARLSAMMFGEPSEPMRMGRFVLLDRLGQGGMGVVYSAYDPQLDRRVALKLVRTRKNTSSDAKERLLREAQALARLSHPNVVPVYDVGLIDDQVFVVMEFVVGQTLRAWVEETERDWRDVLAAYLQAGRGLAAAHEVGLMHRDFKPDNVQVGDDGRIRVLDFGLARGHGERAPSEAEDTVKVAFRSPADDDHSVDALADTGMLLEPETKAVVEERTMALGEDDEDSAALALTLAVPVGQDAGEDQSEDEDSAALALTLAVPVGHGAGVDHGEDEDSAALVLTQALPTDEDEDAEESQDRGEDEGAVAETELPPANREGGLVVTRTSLGGSQSDSFDMPMFGRIPTDSDLANTLEQRRLEVSMTATGAIIGTPAYMSPEQFAGVKLGPETDQFSFCASLWEGLYGRRPFTGDTMAELGARVTSGDLEEIPRPTRVPGWVHDILVRGLQPEPADRYPSMEAILAALESDPARTRRRWLLGLLVAALVAVSVYLVATRPGENRLAVCQSARAEIQSAWGPSQRGALQELILSIDRPYAKEAWPRVHGGLDDYAETWATMHQEACLANQRGEQSDTLLDRRMSCLGRRKVALESAVEVLGETDADTLGNAVEVVSKLPPIDYCGNQEAMEAEIPPPEDPEVARKVAELQGQLSRARAREDAGRYVEAQELASSIAAEAKSLEYDPLYVEALLVQGRSAQSANKPLEALEPLKETARLGLSIGMNEPALEALAREVYTRETAKQTSSDAEEWLPWIEALTERFRDRIFVHALLLNNVGAVYMARRDRDQARAYFERALAIKNRTAPGRYIELVNIYLNLSLLTEDDDVRAHLLDTARDELSQTLGALHPRTLVLQLSAGYSTRKLLAAYQLLQKTCEAYDQFHQDQLTYLVPCFYALAFLSMERERLKEALSYLDRVEVLTRDQKLTPNLAAYRRLTIAQGHLYRNDLERSRAAFNELIAELEETDQLWWRELKIAHARLGIALGYQTESNHRGAIEQLQNALPIFVRATELNQNADTERRLAKTRERLAMSLWDAGKRDPDSKQRIARLLDNALSWYRQTGAGDEERVKRLEAWQKERGILLIEAEPSEPQSVSD